MGAFSIFHWLIVFALVAIPVPFARLLQRTGHSAVWCLLYFVPLVNVFALWIFAFESWPIDKKRQESQ